MQAENNSPVELLGYWKPAHQCASPTCFAFSLLRLLALSSNHLLERVTAKGWYCWYYVARQVRYS